MKTRAELTYEEKELIWGLAIDCLKSSKRFQKSGAFCLRDVLLTTSFLMNVQSRTKSGEALTVRKLDGILESVFVDLLDKE